jgi:hypothetical protein
MTPAVTDAPTTKNDELPARRFGSGAMIEAETCRSFMAISQPVAM